MTETFQQLVREFEERMTGLHQQLLKESEDLKDEIRELHRTNEILRAEKTLLTAENLKLKNSMLHSIESMRDSLAAIVVEANEAAAEVKAAGEEVSSGAYA